MLTTPMKRMLLANRQASTIASLTNLRGKIPNGDNKVSMDFPVNRSNYPNYNYIKISYICYNNRNKSINCFNSFTKRFYTSDLSEANIQRELVLYSNKKQTPVSLQALMDTGKGNKLGDFASKSIESSRPLDKILMQVACFLHRELPVRLAHRAVKLEAFPLFARSENLKIVRSWYVTSFLQLRAFPIPNNAEREKEFAKLLEDIYERHAHTLITMARAAHEIRTMMNSNVDEFAELAEVQRRLDKFYLSRIGIRMLIGQYLALRQPSEDEDMIGLLSQRTSPYEIAQQVISDAAYMCTRQHGDAPVVNILGRKDLTFPYVPSHLSYMLLELLKNSMRATVETHGLDNMPPIRIIIADGEDNEDVVIKVSDEGGGIKRSNMDRIWSYLFTTADPSVIERMLDTSADSKDFDTAAPLAGLGYGLPISRCYARFFGGDMSIMSMEGYGTDSFIHLPRLGNKESVI